MGNALSPAIVDIRECVVVGVIPLAEYLTTATPDDTTARDWADTWTYAATLDDDALTFLRQNEHFAASLDTMGGGELGEITTNLDAVEGYAGHHAGGMFVLERELDGGLEVKCHDSWDGPDAEGRSIVVHIYDPAADGEGDVVTYYATAGEAFAAFMDAEAGRRPVGLEARCSKCGETFNPADEDDTEHVAKADGTECGGAGEITGAWY